MKRRRIALTVLTVMAMAAFGCAAKQPAKPKVDPAIKKLNRAAESIQADLERLSKIKQAGHEKVKPQAAPKDGPLAKRITFKWSGPLSDALEAVASMTGYEFRVKGEEPAAPVLVNVDSVEEPAFSVLEDLGWKAGKHRVSLDAKKGIIQLTYFEDSIRTTEER